MGYEEYVSAGRAVPDSDRGDRLRAVGSAGGGLSLRARCSKRAKHGVDNQYARLVRREGNAPALRLIHEVFEITDRKWRGIGTIPQSGFRLAPDYEQFDAERRFAVEAVEVANRSACISGLMLQGVKKPRDCPAFGKECTPGASAGSHDGLLRGRLRGLLPLCPLPSQAGRGRFGNCDRAGSLKRSSDFASQPCLTRSTSIDSRVRCRWPIMRRCCLGHGSGGKLTAELIQHVFLPGLGQSRRLAALEDQATLDLGQVWRPHNGTKAPRIAFTTDSFVVRPLFFPGGDIGKLAVHGTVNDLAVGGATPLFLSAAFILEEGLPMDDLRRIVASMRAACDEAGVALVTGDTKVVDRGKGDGVFITTSGIGLVRRGPAAVDPRSPAGRPGAGFGNDGRSRHRHHVGSRRDRIRDRARERHGVAGRSDPSHARALTVDPLHARPDSRRAGQRAQRDCRGLAGGHPAGRGGDSRAGAKCTRHAKCSASIRCTSPTKASSSPLSRRMTPRDVLEAMRAHPLGRDAADIGTGGGRTTREWSS